MSKPDPKKPEAARVGFHNIDRVRNLVEQHASLVEFRASGIRFYVAVPDGVDEASLKAGLDNATREGIRKIEAALESHGFDVTPAPPTE